MSPIGKSHQSLVGFNTPRNHHDAKMSLILASSSIYRKQQLKNLGFEFECISPDIDETALRHEHPKLVCVRLAREKAQKIIETHPESTVVAADQVCVLEEDRLGKPGTKERAVVQLTRMSGKSVLFHSAVVVRNQEYVLDAIVTTEVVFRELTQNEIRRYVELDNPIDCAGGLKSERAGSLLLKRVSSDDPTALIGLPLIQTATMLRDLGISPLT